MRLNRRDVLAALIGLALSIGGNASADPKADLLHYLAQHGYCFAKVDNSQNNKSFIRAKVNGQDLKLFIDTGWGQTTLTADAARELGLKVEDTGKQKMGVGGMIRGDTGIALINRFQLNNVDINRTNTILVLPRDNRWDEADGALGFDYLHLNAALLPVCSPVMFFKPGTQPIPDISPYMDAIGFKAIPLHYEDGGLRVEGSLDGHDFNAVLDCGASFTTFDLDYAKAAGQHPRSIGIKFSGIDGREIDSSGFTPKQFSLGSFHVPPIEVVAAPAPVFSKIGANALLGCDVLATHYAIIDLGRDVLWMK
jgi:predicted aspartyl protease